MVQKDRNFVVSVIDYFHQSLTISISRGSKRWVCSAIYASPVPAGRELLWEHLNNSRYSVHAPWFLVGDFNDIILPSEVSGGMFSVARGARFSKVMEDCGLMDLGAKGHRFTWYRKARGARPISKHLDRAFSDSDWRVQFPEAYVENLVRHHSDHCPMLLRCKAVIPDKHARPFRFRAAWLFHKDFPSIVQSAWIKGNHRVPISLDSVRKYALEFNENVFGNIFKRKRKLEARIRGLQRSLEKCDDLRLTILDVDL